MFKSPDFTYDASIRMWTADSADAAYEVLASPALRVYNLAKFYDMLAAETGREFLLSRYYSDYILLSNEDEQHAALRKLAAQRFHASARAVRLAATEAVNQITTRFSTPGTFDLIDDLISPLTHKVVVALAGVGTHVVASDILAPSRSLTKMRRIEAELVVMHDYVEAHFPSETPDSRATRVSLALIGYEPLKAGLGNNLATIIMQANGQRLNEIDWPQDLIATAVRKLVRVARDPASCPIPVVEISTELFLSGDKRNAASLFGRGNHSCMGRGLSMQIWKSLADTLSKLPHRVEMLDYTAPEHWLFNIPKRAKIRISL